MKKRYSFLLVVTSVFLLSGQAFAEWAKTIRLNAYAFDS